MIALNYTESTEDSLSTLKMNILKQVNKTRYSLRIYSQTTTMKHDQNMTFTTR